MKAGPSHILPQLFLGGYLDARDMETLSTLGVTSILNVSESARDEEASRMNYCHVPLSDYGDSDLAELFVRCFDFIDAARKQGHGVLVHCRHGQNRSPSVTIAYLVEREGLTLRDAYRLVEKTRPQIALHEDYFKQLQRLEKSRHGSISFTQEEVGESVQEFIRNLRFGKSH